MCGAIAAGEVGLRRFPATSRPVESTAFSPRISALPERSRLAFHWSKAQHDFRKDERDVVAAFRTVRKAGAPRRNPLFTKRLPITAGSLITVQSAPGAPPDHLDRLEVRLARCRGTAHARRRLGRLLRRLRAGRDQRSVRS